MRRNVVRGVARAGFTLIELLVVIAIIAVLVGLTAAGVMKFIVKGPEAAARQEINQLSAAIAMFKRQFEVKSMPSKMVLHETLSNYDLTNADQARSRQFLSSMFGRRLQGAIDWDNNGTIETVAANGKVLYGEQCLVFFLGGAQAKTAPYGCLGFSSSPSNPMQADGVRRGPFYEFNANRLVPVNGFYVYVDAFQVNNNSKPYVYLSDYATNDYRADSDQPVGVSPTVKVTPYLASAAPKRYINQGGFQIISAGADGLFGASASYTPTTGTDDPNGVDDFANFSSARLAVPQE